MRRLVPVVLFLASAPALFAQAEAPLPVRKVVLYKNGIGHFEHRGETRGQRAVAIELPSSQLDDVLKSLTVIDLGQGGQVAGVSYTTLAPLDRRLDEIALDLTSAEGLAHFLNQIKGARVEVGTVSGKLMGAEVKRRETGSGGTIETTEALVFTSQGQVRAVELGSAASIRLLDSELSTQVSRYLDLLRTGHERDVRRLEIETLGQGSRSLQVSYTSEAPIWKTTYRLALEEGKKPLLQGWAIVDNVSAMDWSGVELSLVAGAPVSFVQNLSQPIYSRRPRVPLPEGVQVAPQTHGAALDVSGEGTRIAGSVIDEEGMALPGALVQVFDRDGNSAGEAYADAEGDFAMTVAPGSYRVSASLLGFSTQEYGDVNVARGRTRQLDFQLAIAGVSETVTVTGEAPMFEKEPARGRAAERAAGLVPAAPPAPISQALREARLETAQARELGDQFEYRLPHPVTIGRNRSALLPIVQTEVPGEKVSIYNEASGDPRPRLAVSLVNETGLTLDAGSFTVLEGDAFAGEGLTEVIRPKEKRILSYGLDLHLDVAVKREGAPERVTKVAIGRGVLRREVKLRRKAAYAVRNQDDKKRIVLIEHPVESEWTLVETPPPVETTAGEHRFRVEASPGATTELVVQEESARETTYALSNVSAAQIALWLEERSIDPEIERVLRQVVAKRDEIEAVRRETQSLDSEQANLFDDQQRLRENLGKLGDSSEEKGLRRRYVAELEKQENRLEAIRAERARLETDLRKLQEELDALVREVAFEKDF